MTNGTEIGFVDQTLRDGNQCVWALMMPTSMMVSVGSRMNEAGFKAVEVIAPAHFKTIVRDLREDPWERVRLMAKRITNVPLAAMQQCSITGFGIVPKCLVELWMKRLAANGIRRLHLIEPSNDYSLRAPYFVQFARNAGLDVALGLTYSISPKHTDEYFVRKVRDAAALNVGAIFLKDPGGLLTPERVRTLVPALLNNLGDVPLELHAHCTTGLAPLCYIEAVKLGIKTLHTAIPPLANSSAQPSVLNIANNLRHLGYTPMIDEKVVGSVSDHLQFIAKRENRILGVPVEYDYYQYVHQIPGGVMSNLKRQLSQLKVVHKLPEVIDESIRVRKEFGYPIMVSPFSQFVMIQAAINVVLGERYKRVVDDLIYYALGFWGKEASSAIDPEVMDVIMNSERAKELANWEPPEPSLQELRVKYGGANLPDDELLLRYIVGSNEDISTMRAAGPIQEDKYIGVGTPLPTLIEALLKRRDLRYVGIRMKELEIAIEN
jgi:oxaloacetate decarboxylase alpha subunit